MEVQKEVHHRVIEFIKEGVYSDLVCHEQGPDLSCEHGARAWMYCTGETMVSKNVTEIAVSQRGSMQHK